MEHPTVELERKIASYRSQIVDYYEIIKSLEIEIESIQQLVNGINKQRTSVKEDETTE